MSLETPPTGAHLDEAALHDLIAPELERWKVPGVEVAVVRKGEPVFAGGFGTPDASSGRPVTSATLFHHGSTGKSFTALLAAVLVDEGLLEWDRPVAGYVPDFRLHDAVYTDRVTTRDLLSHRSGLPRHELMWVANPSWDRAELVRRLRHLELNRDLRTEFQYCNLGYVAVGHMIGAVTGSTWEEQLRARVLEPLGMSRTVASLDAARELGELALPYGERDGEIAEVPYRPIDASAPAGQVISCAADSARWLQFQAGGGELEGERLISEETFAQTRSIQVPVQFPTILPDQAGWGPTWLGYGLGWMVCTYRQRQAIWHSGGIDGFSTMVMVLPEDRSAVLVSANTGNGSFTMALLLDLVDRVLGAEPRPWQDRLFTQFEQATAAEREQQAKRRVVPDTSPSHPLRQFAGTYEHPGYGVLQVDAGSGPNELSMRLGELDLAVEHRHYDTWAARYEPLEIDFSVTFLTDAEGDVTEAWAGLEETVPPIRFARSREESGVEST
jgi:CubicO group peptidase (beta-lactamase class C family)